MVGGGVVRSSRSRSGRWAHPAADVHVEHLHALEFVDDQPSLIGGQFRRSRLPEEDRRCHWARLQAWVEFQVRQIGVQTAFRALLDEAGHCRGHWDSFASSIWDSASTQERSDGGPGRPRRHRRRPTPRARRQGDAHQELCSPGDQDGAVLQERQPPAAGPSGTAVRQDGSGRTATRGCNRTSRGRCRSVDPAHPSMETSSTRLSVTSSASAASVDRLRFHDEPFASFGDIRRRLWGQNMASGASVGVKQIQSAKFFNRMISCHQFTILA